MAGNILIVEADNNNKGFQVFGEDEILKDVPTKSLIIPNGCRFADTRASLSKKNKITTYLLSQIGRANVDVIIFTDNLSKIDLRVRKLATILKLK